MDNNKLIIGAILAVVAFLGAPFALKALRPAPAPAPAAQPAAQGPAPNSPMGAQNPAFPAAQAPPQMPQQSQFAQQELNQQTLVGTVWEVSASQGTAKFQFNAGGQGVVLHPIAGQVPATWTCSGNQVHVTASAFGQTMSVSAQIQGGTLVGQGSTIRRLQ